MKPTPTRAGRYTFANTDRGRELRRYTRSSLASQGIISEESEEVLTFSTGECTLLLLTVIGKRPGEGQIANWVKEARKARKIMKYTHYSRCIIETAQVERLVFSPEHYDNAGISQLECGIPELEALRLLNSWNSRGLKYNYWL